MDTVDFIIRFESGEELTPRELIDGFAALVKAGQVHALPGHSYQIAEQLIAKGWISKEGKVLKYPPGSEEG